MIYDPTNTVRATVYRVVWVADTAELELVKNVYSIDVNKNIAQIYSGRVIENELEIVEVSLKSAKVLQFGCQSFVFILEFDGNYVKNNKF